MQRPKSVTVGDLVAHAQRPPIESDPRWWWRCRRYDPATQKQVSAWRGRGTRREVEEALISIRDNEPKPTAQRTATSPVVSIGDLLDAWYSTTVHDCRKPTTQTTYRNHARLAKRFMGKFRIELVTTADLEAARRAMAEEYAPWSVRSAFSVTRSAWRWGLDIAAIRAVMPTFPQLDRRRVSDGYTPPMADVWAVIDSYNPVRARATRAVLIIMVATGCRPSEAVNVTHRDVEVHGDSVALIFGRHAGAEKTGDRRVPIFGEAAALVRELHDQRPAAADTRIVLRGNGLPISADYAKNLARSLKMRPWDSLGIRAFTPQAIRRAAVDNFARSGVSAGDAAAILGHSVETMLTFYRQVSERDKAEAMLRAGMGRRSGSPVQSLQAQRARKNR